ncbi:hypothetical protein PM1_010 [Pectobacterium phage PM1]|uniref:Uncharacterized protein n=1 Tax=Pectobacterium phage PM1 TaxID=1399915 RepID=X2CSV0_9CAUD|nr:hypothetical protein PM1_010 [Pectobacterium phage PM1]AGV99226.1 hypothetical protein PM1_010 [Pectobacterium phage PM1]
MKILYRIVNATFYLALLVLATLCLAFILATATKAATFPRTAAFDCQGFDVSLHQDSAKHPIFASIRLEKGLWMEVPQESRDYAIFMNIDNGRIARMGNKPDGRIYLSLYADTNMAQADKSEHDLICRKI